MKIAESADNCGKEKLLILKIIKEFFNPSNEPIDFSDINQEKLFALIKETATDGICYLVLKERKGFAGIVSRLKPRFEIALKIDQQLQEAFVEINPIPVKKIFLKDCVYRFTENYIPGTRYGCDIDLYIDPEDLNLFDTLLEKKRTYSEGPELTRAAALIDLAYAINKNIAEYVPFQEALRPIIEEAKTSRFRNRAPAILEKMHELKTTVEKIIDITDNLPPKDAITQGLELMKKETAVIKDWVKTNKAIVEEEVSESLGAREIIALRAKLRDDIQKIIRALHDSLFEKSERAIERIGLAYPSLDIPRTRIVSEYQKTRDDLMKIANLTMEDLNRAINRKKMIFENLASGEGLQYFFVNGAFVDVGHRLSRGNAPFRMEIDWLSSEPFDRYTYILKTEDSIVHDACHYCSDLKRCRVLPRFHGFLKYLTDIHYKLKGRPLDWERVVELARRTNSSSQVYFYLNLGKNYLGVPVPDGIMGKLRKNGSWLQNFLLAHIDGLKLLFNEPTFCVKLYAKIYLNEKN